MFGCSDGGNRYWLNDHMADRWANPRARDRLTHMDEVNQERLAERWESRQLSRRSLFKSAGIFALAGAAGPLFPTGGMAHSGPGGADIGNEVVISSIPNETVRLGQFRMDVPDLTTVDSETVLVYPDTLTHFLGALKPGVPIGDLAKLRLDNPGKGPHSVIGPVAVRDAKPGDMVEVRFLKLDPIDFGANFHNPLLPGVRTGALPEEFPAGQVIYFDLDRENMRTEFRPGSGIHIPLAPFQGIFGVAPPGAAEAVNSVPPGQHAGNIDLRDLTAGSTLWIPVWRDGARLYTADTHVAQGDGEVNLTAIESALRELRVKVILHPGALANVPEADRWPMAETATHWIAIATAAPEPNQATAFREAFLRALHNVINFLHTRVGLTRDDAYALSSIAVSFRITQVVDINIGVHGMIPKDIFEEEVRQRITIAD